MKPLPFREVKRKLEAAGFSVAGQTGSHIKFVKITDSGARSAIVPKHSEVAAGTIRSICDRRGSIGTGSIRYKMMTEDYGARVANL